MNTPPTTDLAWKPAIRPSVTQYQSVSGTRVGDSLAYVASGATSARKSSLRSARVAVHTIQSSLVYG